MSQILSPEARERRESPSSARFRWAAPRAGNSAELAWLYASTCPLHGSPLRTVSGCSSADAPALTLRNPPFASQ